MPMLFITMFVLILFGLYVYQKTALYYVTTVSAERVAFRWDNSNRDVLSAMAPPDHYDSLYWRLSSDGALQSLFGIGGEDGRAVVAAGSRGGGNSSSNQASVLAQTKLKRIAERISAPYEGELSYTFGIAEKEVKSQLRYPFSISTLARFGYDEPKTVSSAVIVDPVEFIRNVDLVRYYTVKLKEAGSGGAKYRSKAAEVLRDRKSKI